MGSKTKDKSKDEFFIKKPSLDWEDPYIQDKVLRLFYEEIYECMVIIDTETASYIMHDSAYGNLDASLLAGGNYEDAQKRAAELYTLAKDRELYIKNTSIANIKKQLDKTGYYSFTITAVKEQQTHRRRYNCYYIDDVQKFVLMTVEDVTNVLEHDMLTGEYNRCGFLDCVRRILSTSKKEEDFAILFFNIKGFKVINELFGVEGGDNVLRTCIESIKNSILKPLAISRFEGDHFVALIRQEKLNFDVLTELCDRSYEMNGKHLKFYARCGIYLIKDKTRNISGMCDRAKLAKEYIVDDYVKPYAVFDDSMKAAFVTKRQLTSDLMKSLENHEFEVYYQTIYNLKTGQVTSAEALIRWTHPTLGMISPGQFIPIFEENGYISELDLFVNDSVKEFLERRLSKGFPVVPVAVNLSRMDFYDQEMMKKLIRQLETTTVPKGIPRFEITESAYSSITEQRNDFLHVMQEKGAKILIDDFGSGYSSFSTIRDFPFDIIKLDMGFIQNIGKNPRSEYVIQAMISLAHSMNTAVIAEGVETQEQVDFLQAHNCDYVQGFYYSKPMPEGEFCKVLANISA